MTYALIALTGSYAIAFLRAPAIQFLAQHLSYAAGLPWAASLACGITRDRVALIVLVAVLVLFVAPNGIQNLAQALVPVGAGLVIGHFIGLGIREERGQSI
jgi:hypothetical protein